MTEFVGGTPEVPHFERPGLVGEVTHPLRESDPSGEVDPGLQLAERLLVTPGLQFALYGKYESGQFGPALVKPLFHTTDEGLQSGELTWGIDQVFKMGWLDSSFWSQVSRKDVFDPAIVQWCVGKFRVLTLAFGDQKGDTRIGNHSEFHVTLPQDRDVAATIVQAVGQAPSTLVHLLQMVYNSESRTVQGDRSKGTLLEKARELPVGEAIHDLGVVDRDMGCFRRTRY